VSKEAGQEFDARPMHLDPKTKAQKIKKDFYPQMSQIRADE
jgi:hypothetical protein